MLLSACVAALLATLTVVLVASRFLLGAGDARRGLDRAIMVQALTRLGALADWLNDGAKGFKFRAQPVNGRATTLRKARLRGLVLGRGGGLRRVLARPFTGWVVVCRQ